MVPNKLSFHENIIITLKNKFIKIKKKIIFDIVKRKKIKHYKK